jgi:hypothetical protein
LPVVNKSAETAERCCRFVVEKNPEKGGKVWKLAAQKLVAKNRWNPSPSDAPQTFLPGIG